MTWRETLLAMLSGRMLIALLMGFASGLPLLLTGSVLQAWLKDGGIKLTDIGLFALVGLPYTLKFLWAPLFDRYALPRFGRRRGWLMVTQLALAAALAALSLARPMPDHLLWIAVASLIVAFFRPRKTSWSMLTAVKACQMMSWGWAPRCMSTATASACYWRAAAG